MIEPRTFSEYMYKIQISEQTFCNISSLSLHIILRIASTGLSASESVEILYCWKSNPEHYSVHHPIQGDLGLFIISNYTLYTAYFSFKN